MMGRMDLSDAALPGLRLRLTANGARSWVLACRDTLGRMRRFRLGDYPTMGIASARKAARTMRSDVGRGVDPIAERKRQRAIGHQARDGIGTLTALLDLYARQKGDRLKSWAECRRRINSVFAPFLNKPVAAMKAGDLQMQADGWAAVQSAAAAVRYLRPVLKWAAQRSYVARDLAQLALPATAGRRKRVLTRDELAVVLTVLRASSRPYAPALRFMLLTLSRRQETALARWRDLNFESRSWTIIETKNGEPHTVPLSRQALELLRSRLPVDASGSLKQPDPAALIFSTSTGAPLCSWDRGDEDAARGQRHGGMDPPRSEAHGRDLAWRDGRTAGHHRSRVEPRFHPVATGRDLQPVEVSAAGGGGPATVGGRAGRDRSGWGRIGVAPSTSGRSAGRQ